MTAFIIVVLFQSLFMALIWKSDTKINAGFKIWFMAMTVWSIVSLIDIL